jgi:hypothetical protein
MLRVSLWRADSSLAFEALLTVRLGPKDLIDSASFSWGLRVRNAVIM